MTGGKSMKRTRFIQEEEKQLILKDFHNGLNTVELGKKYGRSDSAIGRLLKKNGLKTRNEKAKLTEKEVRKAHELYTKELMTTEKLGEMYKVDANTIANSFRSYGLKVRPNGHIPAVKDENIFKVIDSEEKAYFLGLLMADGSIVRDKTSYTMRLELEESDYHIMKEFAGFLGLPESRIRKYTRSDKNLVTNVINIGSTKFCQNLMDKGIVPNKTGKKIIPTGVPNDLVRHTIRGLIDGDGTIRTDLRVVVLYGGGGMVYQVADYLYGNLDLSGRPTTKKYDGVVPRMTTRPNDFDEIISYLYEDATIFLKRKNPYHTAQRTKEF